MNNKAMIKTGTLILLLAIVSITMFTRCKTEEFTERTNYELLIGEYLEENPEQFSTFVHVLEKSHTMAFLKAYGAYTVFAPTNAAFDEYVASKGKASIDDFTEEELKDLVRYHTIADTISTTMFIDGKLQSPTMYGQYLTSRVYFEDGQAIYKLNKYAPIDITDKRLLNGVFHSVTKVLDPVTKTIAQLIEENPDYSIFSDALKATGYYDTLNIAVEKNDEDPRWFTALVVPNSAYNADQIDDVNELIAKYSNTGNPKDPADSMFLYVAYHCIDRRLNYIADLQSSQAHLTMAPNEVITIKTKGVEVWVNDDVFAGVVEPGYQINRIFSDNSANNGVYHQMESDFNIKLRKPMAVYWDVCDQLEIRKMPGIYGRQGTTLVYDQLADVKWYGENNTIQYIWSTGSPNSTYPFVKGDYFQVYLRPSVVRWIEFKTPVLVKGQYKVWVCTRNQYYEPTNKRRPLFFVYFNEEVLPIIIDNNVTLNRNYTEEEYELQGLKWYSFNPTDSTQLRYINSDGSSRFTSQLAGTIDVPVTGQHYIKFVGISAFAENYLWLDQIQFIPVDHDQLWPRRNTRDNSDVFKEGLPYVPEP